MEELSSQGLLIKLVNDIYNRVSHEGGVNCGHEGLLDMRYTYELSIYRDACIKAELSFVTEYPRRLTTFYSQPYVYTVYICKCIYLPLIHSQNLTECDFDTFFFCRINSMIFLNLKTTCL